MTLVSPRAAATVLMVRDDEAGPQIFMVRRHHGNKFMANAHVFVGGRVDPADGDPALAARCRGIDGAEAARRLGLDDPDFARGVYVAALREAFEESGLLLARQASGEPVAPHTLAPLRDRINAGQAGLAALLTEADLSLCLGELRFLTRWVTPQVEPRRFDAFFFVARAPAGQRATYDERETTEGDWYTAAALLAANRRREVLLAPPTLTVLEALEGARDVDALLALAGDRPIAPVCPRLLEPRTAEIVLLLPGDHRYADPRSNAGPEHYVVLRDGHWQRIRVPTPEVDGALFGE